MGRFLLVLFLAMGFASFVLASGTQTYRVGVLVGPSPATVVSAFQPTVDFLGRASTYGVGFQLVPLRAGELGEAVAGRRVDFVITRPDHFIDLQARYRVTAIASVVRVAGGVNLSEAGGLILVRGDRSDLAKLGDLRGKAIAVVDADSLPGYLAPAGELADLGIDLRRDARLTDSLTPEQVLQAVTAGESDAGFLPAGAAEALAGQGRAQLDKIRVLNRQQVEGFPYLLSTRLYPDWLLARLGHVPEPLAKQVAATLLSMGTGPSAQWHGDHIEWSMPLGLEPVHRLMRALRLSPYDKGASFGFRDVLRKYEFEAFALLAVTLAGLFAVLVKFKRLNHQLAGQMMLTHERRRELEEEIRVRQRAEGRLAGANSILATLAAASPLPVVLERLIAMHEKERPGKPVAILLFDSERGHYNVAAHGNIDADFMRDIESAAAIVAGDGSPGPGMNRLCKRCGSMQAEPVRSEAGVRLACLLMANPSSESERGLVQSLISLATLSIQRADAANRLRLNASVFENSLEGIMVADSAANIIDVNRAFTRLTGYEREDVIGQNPRFLKSGRHDNDFYVRMWAAIIETGIWQGEIWNRRKDGEVIVEMLHIAAIRDSGGQITHYFGKFSDITVLKETQSRLSRATYGTTDWPN